MPLNTNAAPIDVNGSRGESLRKYQKPTSTVGRGKAITTTTPTEATSWADEYVSLNWGDSLAEYEKWESPTVIISDGAYGVLGFEGDTSDHLGLPEWYEPHVAAWAQRARTRTTLWFWNSEIGWASVHPILEKHGWRYVNANVWNKGKGHIAGNVHTSVIRRFPVVTELCVQYIFEPRVSGLSLKEWLLHEWKRTGLPLRLANTACGVADAAVRKYFDQGHLWYFPPPDKFAQIVAYANEHGKPDGRPYFCMLGTRPATAEEWAEMRSKFYCPHGYTNVWSREPLRGPERVKTSSGKAVHLNQKPLDLMRLIIEAASDRGDVVWEPFGGLFSGALAARQLERKAYSAEVDETYFQYGVRRFIQEVSQRSLF